MSSRSRRAVGAWLAVATVVAGFLALPRIAGSAETETELTPDVVRGEQLYALNCAACHGGDGRGGQTSAGDSAPPLAGEDPVTLAYMDLVMDTGRMPPPGDPFDNRGREVTLSPQEQADILAYVEQDLGLEGRVEVPEPGSAGRGLELYARNCASCHGATGAGGVAGAGAYTPRINELEPQTIAQAIRIGPFQMPAFDSSQISDDEVGDIAAFLETVEEEGGTLLFGGELNPVYASGFAVFLALAAVVVSVLVAGKPVRIPDHPSEDEPEPAAEEDPDSGKERER